MGDKALSINTLKSFQEVIISSGSFQPDNKIIFTSKPSFFIFSKESFVAFCPASSPSKQRYTFFVSLFIRVKCFSVKAVPDTQTTFVNHHLTRAITSIYHSHIITKSSLVIVFLALNKLYKIFDLS
jgi:hypothetical protein